MPGGAARLPSSTTTPSLTRIKAPLVESFVLVTTVTSAPAGIAAGRAAGMRVVAVRTEMTAGLSLAGAERIIDSLEDFELSWLKATEAEGACAGV